MIIHETFIPFTLVAEDDLSGPPPLESWQLMSFKLAAGKGEIKDEDGRVHRIPCWHESVLMVSRDKILNRTMRAWGPKKGLSVFCCSNGRHLVGLPYFAAVVDRKACTEKDYADYVAFVSEVNESSEQVWEEHGKMKRSIWIRAGALL